MWVHNTQQYCRREMTRWWCLDWPPEWGPLYKLKTILVRAWCSVTTCGSCTRRILSMSGWGVWFPNETASWELCNEVQYQTLGRSLIHWCLHDASDCRPVPGHWASGAVGFHRYTGSGSHFAMVSGSYWSRGDPGCVLHIICSRSLESVHVMDMNQ